MAVAPGNSTNQTATNLLWTWWQLHRETLPTKQLQISFGLGGSCTGKLYQPNSYKSPLDLVTVAPGNSTNQTATNLLWTWWQLHWGTLPTKSLQISFGLGDSCTGELYEPNSYKPPLDMVTVAPGNSTNQTATNLLWTWWQFPRRGKSANQTAELSVL